MFEIVEQVVDGAPVKVFANAPTSLRALWEMSALHASSDYLVYEGERYTYARAHDIVATIAHRLVFDLGVAKGDRVAIAMRNYPEWVFAFWASASVGAVVVPLNAWWTGPELAYGLSHSGTTVLIADSERLERLAPHLAETQVRTVVATRCTGPLPADAMAFEDLVGDGTGADAAALPPVEIGPDDDATIMYTSGTTGRPKGAVGTQRNIGANVMNLMYAMASTLAPPSGGGAGGLPSVPTALLTLPLFHVGGLHTLLVPYTVAGGKIVLIPKWDAAHALDLIEEEGVTVAGGVPTTVFDLLDEARRQDRPMPSLSGVASGATLVPPELVRRIDAQLDSRASPTNGYGLTETSGPAVANGGRTYLDRPDSVGTAIAPVMEIRIADPDGTPVPAGEVGEIWLRGPTIIRGYLDNPEATAAAISDGWFHTGDAGTLDEDGFLRVVDRLKDVIIRGGENIYAAEVEAVLYEHPDVLEAAIVGVPHDRLGEEVAAVVRLRPGATADKGALQQHVKERLAGFKVPSVVHFTPDELPRNAAGKVLKKDLRSSLGTSPAPG